MVLSNLEHSTFDSSGSEAAQRFTTSDGTTLALWRGGAADSVVTYLFAHGWTLDHRSWDDVRARMEAAESDAAFLTYDHRGHGLSDRLPPGTGNLERLADDLAEIIASQVAGPIVLVGHSMGGMTIATLGERHPTLVADRVAGAAFVATTAGPFFPRLRRSPFFSERVIPWYFARGERSAQRPPSQRAARLNARAVLFGRDARNEDIDRALAQAELAGPGVTVEFGMSMSRHSRLRALQPYAAKPVAVVGGSIDRLCPPRHSIALAAALPNASLTLLPDAGHFLPYERSAEVVGRLRSVRRAAGLGAGGGRS
ncbi:alpha/beta hydrolase [Nocardia sp. BSTN01]|uniref:alpha/beta fold hydrolase n=1 Tax=Nocardia sp. BSTN01 TaxID=2783665 RepID=UPI00189052C2|nr:alpha/beta hydrolase [Nocardia sp. BSTN01]MBF5000508.1 alpha/beta hydrolase [Nocardia sp. BSTN01]